MNLIAYGPIWMASWLTPIWVLSLGVFLGIVTLGLLFGIVFLVSKRLGKEIYAIATEGVLMYANWVGLSLASFGVLGALVAHNPREIAESIPALLSTGKQAEIEFVVPPAEEGNAYSEEVAVSLGETGFEAEDFSEINFWSDNPVYMATKPGHVEMAGGVFALERVSEIGGKEKSFVWLRQLDSTFPFEGTVKTVYFQSTLSEPVHGKFEIITAPRHGEVAIVPIAALSVIGFYLVYLSIALFFPRVSAVAFATATSEIQQPLFIILTILGGVALFGFMWIPYQTFGEDYKIFKESGMTLMMILGIAQAVWASSNSISEEIEGKTALTVMSKPLRRWEFVVGKFLGIFWTLALLFLILGTVFLVMVSYKPIIDFRDASRDIPAWQQLFDITMSTIPGLVLAFMEAVIIAAISVAISTRLPLLPNFLLCGTIYALGHLTPTIMQSSDQMFSGVKFIGQLFASVLPVLDHFNIQAVVASGRDIPMIYLLWMALYTILYSTIALMLALFLFEERDLA
ncbi:MAG: ABC transporter permease [Pirellulaceae bacterium]|nr:ABC transporter permease [Pirellulaceae bacterium]